MPDLNIALQYPDAPVFMIGSPRSGSTFAAHLLNAHSQMLMTNESRVMVFACRMLRMLSNRWCVEAHQELFAEIAIDHCRRMVIEFYARLDNGAALRWGDKFPHYADPVHDPDCLTTIEKLFPAVQYIHLVRDPRAVVSSILSKEEELGLQPNLAEAIDVWVRCVTTSRNAGLRVGPDRFLEVKFEDLVPDGKSCLSSILSFLGLQQDKQTAAFLHREERQRTPFSSPTTDIGKMGLSLRGWEGRLDADQLGRIESATADLRAVYGY